MTMQTNLQMLIKALLNAPVPASVVLRSGPLPRGGEMSNRSCQGTSWQGKPICLAGIWVVLQSGEIQGLALCWSLGKKLWNLPLKF